GTFGDATTVNPSFTYTAPGGYDVRLQVTDSHGDSSTSAPIHIAVGNTPPSAHIDSPAASLKWKVGDTITFSGGATDAQEGSLPAADLTWTMILHHCFTIDSCHTHVVQQFTGVGGGSFAAPDHENPSYLELQLTATDAGGLSSTASVSIF